VIAPVLRQSARVPLSRYATCAEQRQPNSADLSALCGAQRKILFAFSIRSCFLQTGSHGQGAANGMRVMRVVEIVVRSRAARRDELDAITLMEFRRRLSP
jgi:hypothetical protein